MSGQYALAWEQAELDRLVADVFGYHALQLGLPALDALRANRMPSRWVLSEQVQGDPAGGPSSVQPVPEAGVGGVAHICADFHLLPFPSASLDLVVMPHTLEAAADPHQTLREVERVLRPEGRIVVTGFNPASLWGVARRLARMMENMRERWGGHMSPTDRTQGARGLTGRADGVDVAAGRAFESQGDWVGYWRLRDWLRLLSFEVEGGRFGCYAPPMSSQRWHERMTWLDPLGDRWWPVLGSVYALVAVKRVRGMRVVGLSRRQARVSAGPSAIVTQNHPRHLPRQGEGS